MPARANIPLLVAVALITTWGASLADAPLAPDEVRERRLVRAERPLWREALALPYDAALLLAWPLKRTLFWAEETHLDDRITNLVRFPFHRGKDDP